MHKCTDTMAITIKYIYKIYINDTKVYNSLGADSELHFSPSLNNIEHCIADIRLWLT